MRPAAEDQARAAEALREAFTRLSPQGSDAWNFLAAFTISATGTAPDHPGASALSDSLGAGPHRRSRPGPLDRLLRASTEAGVDPRREDGPRRGDGARGRGIPLPVGAGRDARGRSGRAGTGRWTVRPGWCRRAALGLGRRTGGGPRPGAEPGGVIIHADCGEGDLLHVLHERGAGGADGSSRAARWRCVPLRAAVR